MKKRIKNKLEKQRNRGIHQQVLNALCNNYTITDIHYFDAYFVFSLGKNAICHFRLKEFPEYLFGIWNYDKTGEFKIFGELEEIIDKFKPTQTFISNTDILGFMNQLNEIQRNPNYFYAIQLGYLDEDELTEEKINLILENHKKLKRLEEEMESMCYKKTFHYFRDGIFEKFEDVIGVGIYKNNKNYCSPQFSITLQLENIFEDNKKFLERCEIISKEINYNSKKLFDKYQKNHYRFECNNIQIGELKSKNFNYYYKKEE